MAEGTRAGVVVLCRHGSTASNAAGRFLSRDDPELSERGRDECAVLREALAGRSLARAFVSPMRRCRETLEIVAAALPYEVRGELREIDFGIWEGATLETLERRSPEALAQRRRDPVHFRPPGGESFADVARRIDRLAGELRRCREPVLVVAHRGTLGVLERLLRGLPLDARDVAPLEPAQFRIVEPSPFPST